MKLKTGILLLALLPAGLLAQTTNQGVRFDPAYKEGSAHVKESEALMITAGDYKAVFSKRTSWTIRELTYKGKRILTIAGNMQPVLNEQVPAKADAFLGTGHRPESEISLEIEVIGGKMPGKYSVHDGLSIPDGDTFILTKRSKFISEFNGPLYEHVAKLTVSAKGLEEDYSFKAIGEGVAKVNFMYVFMHSMPNTTKMWAAYGVKNEIERGEFKDDDSFSFMKDALWLAAFDPAQGIVIVCSYTEQYNGANMFWNRAADNKHYLRIMPTKKAGETFTYHARLSAAEATETTWDKEAAKLTN